SVRLLLQHAADALREQRQRDEGALVERTSIEAVRDAEHAARFIVDDDRHAHERVGTVAPLTGLDRRARDIAHKERTLRLGDETNNSHAWLHAHLSLHIVREAQGAGDHEVSRVVLTKEERRTLTAHELRGNFEDRVEQVFCPPLALTVHRVPHSASALIAPASLGRLACSLRGCAGVSSAPNPGTS